MAVFFEETLPRERWLPRKSGLELLRSVNPLSFLKLFFRGASLRRLTIVQGLSTIAECRYDLEQSFLADQLGWGPQPRGNFMMTQGIASIASVSTTAHPSAESAESAASMLTAT